jgi:putative transcriptional regulator
MRTLSAAEIKLVREGLGLSQVEFARTFHLNLRTLQDWELGAMTPSGPSAVLLWLIAQIPEQIIKTLKGRDGRQVGLARSQP